MHNTKVYSIHISSELSEIIEKQNRNFNFSKFSDYCMMRAIKSDSSILNKFNCKNTR